MLPGLVTSLPWARRTNLAHGQRVSVVAGCSQTCDRASAHAGRIALRAFGLAVVNMSMIRETVGSDAPRYRPKLSAALFGVERPDIGFGSYSGGASVPLLQCMCSFATVCRQDIDRRSSASARGGLPCTHRLCRLGQTCIVGLHCDVEE